jgi:hypothetical protein
MCIPIGQTTTARCRGETLKLVPCEGCGSEYVYKIRRVGQGSGFSLLFLGNAGAQRSATSGAETNLQQKLATGVEAVPCPSCGLYQQAMVPLARKGFGLALRRWAIATMLVPLAVVIVGCVLLAVEEHWLVHSVAIGVFLLGLTLLVLRIVQSRFHDPNTTDADARIALGQRSAMLRSKLEPILQAGGEDPLPALADQDQQRTPWAIFIAMSMPAFLLIAFAISSSTHHHKVVAAQRAVYLAPFQQRLAEYTKPRLDRDVRQTFLNGKVLPVEASSKSIDGILFQFPPELLPQVPEDVGTIVWLESWTEQVGKYTTGEPAIALLCKVTVIDKAENAVVATKVFVGHPPQTRRRNSPNIGARPNGEIIVWLMSLLKKEQPNPGVQAPAQPGIAIASRTNSVRRARLFSSILPNASAIQQRQQRKIGGQRG